MTETERLRALLDGRGVEHLDYDSYCNTSWVTEHPSAENSWRRVWANVHENQTTHNLILTWIVTPEQAVEATLGSDLKAENAKLRELVRDMWTSCPVHDSDCAECTHAIVDDSGEWPRYGCDLFDRMHELGVGA